MTLNSEGLEKAVRAYDDALNNPVFVECKKCQGTGYHHGFGETGHDPDWCLKCGGSKCVLANGEDTRPLRSAISAYLSATPVDGLEVVGHVKPDHPEVVDPLFVRELSQPWMDGIFAEPVVALSQASSVIAGLNKRIEELERARDDAQTANASLSRLIDELDPKFELSRTIARISSLEEENKRLRAVVSASAAALGNGAFISTEASVEFMELLPVEIKAFLSRIGDHNG